MCTSRMGNMHNTSYSKRGGCESRRPVSCALFVDVCMIGDKNKRLGIFYTSARHCHLFAWDPLVQDWLGHRGKGNIREWEPLDHQPMLFMTYRRAPSPHGVQCECQCYDLKDYSVSEWRKVVIMFTLPLWYRTPRDVEDIESISPSKFVKVLNQVLLLVQ
jgi:hypothetical protein